MSKESDAERVAKWIDIVKEGDQCVQALENLGHIGPAAEPALAMICQMFQELGKSGTLGAAAYDALRDHDAVTLCELGLLREIAPPKPAPPASPSSEKIRFNCPQCGKGVTVAIAHAGKRGKCPSCGSTVAIPAAPAVPAVTSVPAKIAELAKPTMPEKTATPAKPVPSATQGINPPPELLARVPKEIAVESKVFPLAAMGGEIALLSATKNSDKQQKLEFIFNCPVTLIVVTQAEIDRLIEKYYP